MATMFDLLVGRTSCPVAEMLGRGSRYSFGGFQVSYMVKRGMFDNESSREQAAREIAEIQLRWLERLGGIRIEGDEAFLVNQTIEIPKVNGEKWSLNDTRPYTLGQSKREGDERIMRGDLLDTWNEVLFGDARSRKLDGVTWTKRSILGAINDARGPIDETAVLLLASSMASIGYDEAYPLLVTVIGDDEYVVDGRHRGEAADERGVTPTKVVRRYTKVEDLLGAIVRADETRRGWDPETAAASWAAVGLSLETIRHWAHTDREQAEHIRKARENELRAARRKRAKEGSSKPAGRPAQPKVEAAAKEIAERQAAGEKVNVAAAAREAGVSKSSLHRAVASVPKPDMSGSGTTPAPTPAANGDLTCEVCGTSGPLVRNMWTQRAQGWLPIAREGGGANQLIGRELVPGIHAHLHCARSARQKGERNARA